jgi:hypothetical protein
MLGFNLSADKVPRDTAVTERLQGLCFICPVCNDCSSQNAALHYELCRRACEAESCHSDANAALVCRLLLMTNTLQCAL